MKVIKEVVDTRYYITKKVICSECGGTGVMPQLDRSQYQEKHTAILSSGNQNTLTSEALPCIINFTCHVCDGSGKIRNDVPLKDALIETMKDLVDTLK